MSNFRRSAVMLLGLALLAFLLFLKGRSEVLTPAPTARPLLSKTSVGPDSPAATAALRPAREPIPWNTKPKAKSDALDKVTPGITAAPSGSEARYVVRDRNVAAFFAPGKVAIALPGRKGAKGGQSHGVGLHWSPEGAGDVAPLASGELVGRVSRMVGDRSTWALDQKSYSTMSYEAILPGIDMTVESRPHGLKYTLYAAAGADVSHLQFRYQGAAGIHPVNDGAGIEIRTTVGSIVENDLHCWQDGPSGRRDVQARYEATGADGYQIVLGDIDPTLPTTIDPTIGWSTFLGASMAPNQDSEEGEAVAVDNASPVNIYVTGPTSSVDFPITAGAYDRNLAGSGDIFVTKICPTNPPGSQIIWSTFLGGSSDDTSYAIAVDAAQNVYVTGYTNSADFPMAGNPVRTTWVASEVFVTKINSTGTGLVFSTFLGGNDSETAYGIVVDNSTPPNVYVGGYTYSTDFPTTSGFDTSITGVEGFITKLDGSKLVGVGNAIVWSTYLGGNGTDAVYSLAIDTAGNVYATGITNSTTGFPVTATNQIKGPGNGSNFDAFVTKVSPSGALLYSTFVGGNFDDIGNSIAVDNAAPTPNIFITGYTYSNLPTSATAYQKNLSSGGPDAYVYKIQPNPVAPAGPLVWCSYLGGNQSDYGYIINVDSTGNAIVGGYTTSPSFGPAANAGFDGTFNPSAQWDGFVAKFNALGTGLIYWTYLGGNDIEWVRGMATDAAGNTYVTGQTYSTDFPTANALKPSRTGTVDAFVSKISPTGGLPWSTYLGGANGPAADDARRVEFDNAGMMYVTGVTYGSDFPVAGAPVGPLSSTLIGDQDVFVSKINPNNPPGTMLIWSVYLGGLYFDDVSALAVDPGGNFVVVGGYSESPDFPHSAAFPNNWGADGWIAKINAAGASPSLAWSRFLAGTTGGGSVQGIALSGAGDIYSTGYTDATDLPGFGSGYQKVPNGSTDSFVILHDPATGAAAKATYLGGDKSDIAVAIKVDTSGGPFNGSVWVGGYTQSTSLLPVSAGAFQPANGGGGYDSFITRLDAGLSTFTFGSYLGGNNYDILYDLALDSTGKAYVTGYTQSPNFPWKAGALSTTLSGTTDGFVCKIDPSQVGAAQLVWSTYLGGSGTDYPYAIRVDATGSVYVAGVTYSPDFPLRNAFDSTTVNGEAFITRINSVGSTLSLAWSSFLGGNNDEAVEGMALGPSGQVWVVGYTNSANYPTFATAPMGVPDSTLNGQEGFVTRIDNQDPNMPVLLQQLRTDGVTTIPLSAWTNQTQIMVKATVTDPEEDLVRLRVEIKPINVMFDGTGVVDSPLSSTGPISMLVTIPAGTEFHWRCRSVDQHGHVSPWNSFGANGDGAAGPPIINAGRDFGFDNTPPTIQIQTPVNADNYFTQLGTISLGGVSSDPLSGVTIVEWTNNNPPPGTAYAATGGTVANWSVGSIPLSSANGGVNVITVRATDGAGNQATDVLTVTWDTQPPTLNITSPVIPPASYTTGLASVSLGGTMGDNIGVAAVNWSRSGGGVPTTNGSGTILTPTTWSATVGLAPGANTITVTAQDAAGKTSSGSSGVIVVNYDNVPPSITINTPSQVTTATSINITGTASDSSGITQVTWSSNRGPTGTATGTTSWNTSAAPQVALLAGVNIITFTAFDGVNNQASAQVTITRDVSDPTVSITTPPNAGTYTTATTPLTLGGSANDDIAVQKVEWQSDREAGSPFHNISNLSGPVTARTWLASGVEAVNLLSGVNVITVRVTDTSNRTGTAVLTVTYNASAPSLVISNPPTSTFVTPNASIPVEGIATSSGAGINITGITVQNKTTGVFSAFSPTGIGTASASFSGGNAATVALVQGTNTVDVVATDSTPLSTTVTLTIIHDPTVPAVTITGPTGADTWAQATALLALNGVASDNRGVTKVRVSNTTTGVLDVLATLVGPPTSLTWSLSIALNPGSNDIVVTAEDAAGNTSTDTLTATYDSTLPTLTITTPASSPTYITSGVTTIDLGGDVGDNVGIASITWTNTRNGATGSATGSPTWSALAVPIDDGTNFITVDAKDTAGNTRNASITIYLDTAIPTLLITAPTNSGFYSTATGTISVGGTAADDISVAQVTWKCQGSVNTTTGTANGTTTWSIDSIPLDPGNNTITVTAHDGRNALSDDTLPTSILVVNYDSVKPTLTIVTPAPPSFSTTSTPILISGTASDGVGVTEVSWVNTATLGSDIASGTTSWSALIPLTSGTNLINVKAKDAAGNFDVKSITIIYDPAAPIVNVTSPTTAVSITTGSSPITIGGTASDDVGLAGVTWSTGGVPVLVNTSNGFLDWSGPVTLSPGSNDVTFTATDTVGRTGTTRITIIYDPTPPTVTITGPTADPVYLTTTSTITIAGVASDNLSVQSVQWSNAATKQSGPAIGVGLWTVPNISLIEGSNDITVTVTDSVGNVSTDMITVIYDGTPPTIAITAPVVVPPASFPTTTRPFDITGTASDNLGLASITFSNDRGGGGTAVPVPALPTTSVTWTASVYLFTGDNVVTITATDQHGYTASTSVKINFTPENIPPSITVLQPPGLSTTSLTQTFDISGTATDNVGVVSVQWKNKLTGVKGTAVLSVPVPPDPDPNLVNWIATIPLARGVNQIVMTVMDDADNKKTATVNVTYDPPSDGTPPGITIVNPNVPAYDATIAPLLITLDASDNDGIASVSWTNDGTGSSGYATFVTGHTWNANLALAIGVNTIKFTAHDPSGNTAEADLLVNFSPGPGDIANPVVTITSNPTGVALNVSSPNITLSGVASDNVLVADVVWLNAATSTSGGADGTTTWDASLVLVPGTNVITLRAYDEAGNTASDQITINYSPPPPFVPAGHCGLLGVDGLALAAAAWLLRRRR